MKHLSKLIPALFLSIFLCIPFALSLFYYTQPMEDVSYELFRLIEDGSTQWDGDREWTVYTNENGVCETLLSDGTGGYTGLSYPGQTFYYSRSLMENLDAPTLKINAVNRTVSVFLDNTLIYTDCPDQDNRIGFLRLPMLEFDRTEPVTISLPPDYCGKELTIAQSTPAASEKQDDQEIVYPCEITLYCGYAYESNLIAQSARTLIPAALLFALLLFLITAFLLNATGGTLLYKLPVLALSVGFIMVNILSRADFFYKYFEALRFDLSDFCFYFSIASLLLFFTLCASELKLLFLFGFLLHFGSTLLSLILQAVPLLAYGNTYLFFMYLPQQTGFFCLLFCMIGAFYLWKRGNSFFALMAQYSLVLIIGYALFLLAALLFAPEYASELFAIFRSQLSLRIPFSALKRLWYLCLLSTLAAVLAELVELAADRRREREMMAMKTYLSQESYENLRLQSEEILMLRHDTMKHYALLQSMAKENPEQVISYLNDLIGQVEAVRPVFSCRNNILNILVNGKLNTAASKGISTHITRSDVPQHFPLRDTQLCCLFVNILDNAIHAAQYSDIPYIDLDFYIRHHHFVFTCKNSVSPDFEKKEPTRLHGYGLKIIHQIMRQFGDNMISIEQSDNTYKITIILPL